MAILRRASREVYRVYSEAEYLAGADEFGEWHRSAPGGDRQERPLRRLGAAARFDRSFGGAGGVIVFAGVGVRTSARDLAANGTSAKGGELLSPRRIDAAPPAGGDRPRGAARGVTPPSVRGEEPAGRPGAGVWSRRARLTRPHLSAQPEARRASRQSRSGRCRPSPTTPPAGMRPNARRGHRRRASSGSSADGGAGGQPGPEPA